MSTDRPAGRPRKGQARIGYAAGGFDLFHVGHLNILRQARIACDYLIAGVVSDEMLLLTKGAPPVVPLAERLEIVRHIRFVDEAVAETVPAKLDTWRSVGFDVFFKGDDWRGTPRGIALERQFAEVGVEVVYFPYTVHTSSTVLRRALETLSPRTLSVSAAGPDGTGPDYSTEIRA
jgi:glycerol-3-phosphate cytidylyltransferase